MKANKQNTIESYMIANDKIGDSFYSDKADRHLTAISTYYKRKIKTERFIAVTSQSDNPSAHKITKVTILGDIKLSLEDKMAIKRKLLGIVFS